MNLRKGPSETKRQELAAAAFRHSQMAIAIAGLSDGRLVELNPACERFFGYERSELVGRSFLDLGLWSSAEDYRCIIDQVSDGKRVVGFVTPFCRKDGHTGKMQITAHAIAMGDDYYFAAIMADAAKVANLENAIREREALLDLFIEHAPAALAMFDTEMRYLVASRRWREDFGLQQQQLRGRSHYEIFPEISPACRAENRRVLGGEIIQFDEFPFRRADGSIQTLRLEERPWHTADGGIGGMVIFAEDITERKKIESDLALSEAIYRAAVDTCRDGFWMVDVEGRLLAVNEAYTRLSGYTREELLGKSVAELEDADSGDDVLLHLEQVRARGTDFFTTWHRAKDGRRWPVEVISAYWPLANAHYFVFLRDISERKRASDALRESEDRFRSTFEQAAVGMAHVAPDGRWLRVNEKLCDILGYTEAELRTMRTEDIAHPDDVQDTQDHIAQVLAGEVLSCSFDKRYIRKDGRVVWTNVTTALAYDQKATYFISVIQDVTESKAVHVELSKLRRRVDDMTKFDVAGHTVAALAHELNQPLNAVSSYAEAALRLLKAGNPQPEKLLHALEKSAQQAQRAGKVVHNLLAILKHGEVQRERVDLNDLARKVVKAGKANAHDQVRFNVQLAAGLPAVHANRLQIQKVLTNLIDNGIEAMHYAGSPAAAVTVTVRTNAEADMAQVTVVDTGPGIDPDMLHRVFDTFFSTKPNGLGVGLAISRTIIEAHGGTLWAESEPGAGASFHFTLPFAP
ncbi:MAG TPA: PAS domain S-box protein [Rhodocyclaceae bacterium]